MSDKARTGIPEHILENLGDRVEVINGEAVEKDMRAAGFLHAFVTDNVYDLLKPFANEHHLGFVVTDSVTYYLHVDEEGVQASRLPDLSFIRFDRIPSDVDFSRPFPGAPTLAVEVVSPSETAEEIQGKLNDYLTYGAEQVWVLYPTSRQLYQYRSDDPKNPRVYSGTDLLDAAALFPGLIITVDQFFVLPERP
jgi:Uma2 family endonuclease